MRTTSTLLLGATLLISGCAPVLSGVMNAGTSSDDVRRKTAEYFGTTVDQIEFMNEKKGLLHTGYSVRHQGTFYNCMVYYGAVKCGEPGKE